MHYALIEKCLKSDKLIKDGIYPNLDLWFIPASQQKKNSSTETQWENNHFVSISQRFDPF